MSLKVDDRFIAWDRNGNCYSYSSPVFWDGELWYAMDGDYNREFHLNFLLPKDMRCERYFDMEDENDRKFIECLLEL